MVSGAVLCSSWLGIQLTVFLEKLLPAGTQVPDNWKFWVVELALLIYLGIRYRFSEDGSNYVIKAKEELSTIRRHRATDFAQSEANRFTKTGHESPVFSEGLGKLTNDLKTARPQINASARPTLLVNLAQQTDSPWKFKIGVTAHWDLDGGGSSTSSGSMIDVHIEGLSRHRIESMSHMQLWAYTDSSIRYLMPVLLGLAATLAVVTNVVSSYRGLLLR